MPSVNFNTSVSGAGLSVSSSVTRSADSVTGYDPTLPAGKAGTLSTRTDDNTGEATLGASHGITTGMIVDVYWDGGVRYGVTVGTVAGTAVPLDGGAGDNFPAEDAAIVVTPQVTINIAIDGDALALLAIKALFASQQSTDKAHIAFYDADDDEIADVDLTAHVAQVYDIAGGASNPFTGDPITYAKASNGSSTAAATLQMIVGQDSTP